MRVFEKQLVSQDCTSPACQFWGKEAVCLPRIFLYTYGTARVYGVQRSLPFFFVLEQINFENVHSQSLRYARFGA